MSDLSVLAITLWLCAAAVAAVSLITPDRLKPPRHDRNRRGFPLKLTIWTTAATMAFLGMIAMITAALGGGSSP